MGDTTMIWQNPEQVPSRPGTYPTRYRNADGSWRPGFSWYWDGTQWRDSETGPALRKQDRQWSYPPEKLAA